jgi:hypothetical protein
MSKVIKSIIFSLAIILSICSAFAKETSTNEAPVWANQFEQEFEETLTYPLIGSSKTKGKIFYDWTNKRYRIDRDNGKWDRYCGSVLKLTETPCSHIVDEGKRYLYFPKKDYCCYCCDSAHGCGILKPDWLSGAEYTGKKTDSNGVSYNVWDKKGLQSNLYWATEAGIMAKIDQQPNDLQEYDVNTYKQAITDASVFNLPEKCNTNTKCPFVSVCTPLRAFSQ